MVPNVSRLTSTKSPALRQQGDVIQPNGSPDAIAAIAAIAMSARKAAPGPFAALLSVLMTAPACYIILAAFSVFTGWLAASLNVWQDEVFTLHTTASGIGRAIHLSLAFEQQPPLYFGLLALWRAVDPSPIFARIFSILCVLAAIFVVERFARRYLRSIPSWLIAGAVAFNPFMIWAAVEIRVYALIILWSVLLLWLFFLGFLDERPRTGARVAYGLLAIVALYTQYYLAAMLLAGGVVLLLLRRWRPLGIYVATTVPAVLSLLPLALVIVGQMHAAEPTSEGSAPEPGYAILLAVLNYTFPHGAILTWIHQARQNVMYGLLVVACVAMASRYRRKLETAEFALLVFAAIITAFFWAVIDLAHQRVLFPRHTAVLLVPASLALFALLTSVKDAWRKFALGAYLAVFAVLSLTTLWEAYHVPAKSGDFERVAAYLSSHVRPGDAVAVFDLEAALPLRQYYQGAAPVVAIPHEMTWDHYDTNTFVLHGPREVGEALQRAGSIDRRLWLVVNDACTRHAAYFGCGALFSYLQDHYDFSGRAEFVGSSVYEFDIRRTANARAE